VASYKPHIAQALGPVWRRLRRAPSNLPRTSAAIGPRFLTAACTSLCLFERDLNIPQLGEFAECLLPLHCSQPFCTPLRPQAGRSDVRASTPFVVATELARPPRCSRENSNRPKLHHGERGPENGYPVCQPRRVVSPHLAAPSAACRGKGSPPSHAPTVFCAKTSGWSRRWGLA
jgi:hypothetical protein